MTYPASAGIAYFDGSVWGASKVIGVDLQAYHANLAAIAGITPVSGYFIQSNAAPALALSAYKMPSAICGVGKALISDGTDLVCSANAAVTINATDGNIAKVVVTDGVKTLENATSGSDYVYPIANATATLGTSEIASGACASAVTVAGTGIIGKSMLCVGNGDPASCCTRSGTGTCSADIIDWGFDSDPTGVTGYSASANGMLTIIAYPTFGNANFKVCNNTGGAVTPGAIYLKWRVRR